MQRYEDDRIRDALDRIGLRHPASCRYNMPRAALFEEAVRRREGVLTGDGSLVVSTGPYTGRAASDKYVVRDALTDGRVAWNAAHQPMDPEVFDALWGRVARHLAGRDVFVQDAWAGADPSERIPIRVITEQAWHALFARTMFLPVEGDPAARSGPGAGRFGCLGPQLPEFHLLHAPGFRATPDRDATRSPVFVAIDFSRRRVLVGGTAYAGEIKKSIFTILNFLLPARDVLPMHCAANVGRAGGDVALYFGLSGTGKTTLSADPERRLIGDDEHGWSPRGVFNFEGGCYAKVIRLCPEAEPQIYATTRRFGTILENVTIDPVTRQIDLDDDALTENTRASYLLDAIPDTVAGGVAGPPHNVVLLTADAFGVLPPIARLSTAQALFHFLSGYTAKVAGTEVGVKEPRATFSTCFGAPFMPLHPGEYAALLGRRLAETGARAWLINTGWSGGPYGVGERMRIAYTRAVLRAALSGALDEAATETDPIFGLAVPREVPGVPREVLSPRRTWRDAADYDAQARKLAAMFAENFRAFAGGVSAEVVEAAPQP